MSNVIIHSDAFDDIARRLRAAARQHGGEFGQQLADRAVALCQRFSRSAPS